MGNAGFTYLPASALESLKGIKLVARSLVEGALLGLHRSPYHGFSSEFAGDRKYAPGDSIRYLDWKALARSGKYFIKEFEEESNLASYVILDSSGSMAMADPAGHTVKFNYACYLAAAFCYLMYRQHDASGLFVYSDEVTCASEARAGRANLTALLGRLETLVPAGPTRNGGCLKKIAGQMPRRSLAVVFSDFFMVDAEFEAALRLLRFKQCEVILFQVLNEAELEFPYRGRVELRDLESGQRLELEAEPVRASYLKRLGEHNRRLGKLCDSLHFMFETLSTSTPFERALAAYFAKREKLF